MVLKDSERYKILKEAVGLLEELKVPDALKVQAFDFLLADISVNAPASAAKAREGATKSGAMPMTGQSQTLREFVKSKNPGSAAAQIPCLLYWAKQNEDKDVFSEDDIVELFRLADIRPPQNVNQAMRDLASKKYKRLETAKDKPGHVRLSRVGEDFVMYGLNAS